MPVTLPCANCGKLVTVRPYVVQHRIAVCCSRECGYAIRRGRPVLARQRRVELTCEVCGETFVETEAHARYRRFCSIACKSEYQKTALRGENNPYYGRPHSDETRALISQNHFRAYGKNNPNWQGGVTDLKALLRKSKRYKQWQMEVFKRDLFRSALSGERGQKWYLVAHHVKPFADILHDFLALYPELDPGNDDDKAELVRLAMDYEPFWDVSNGITLLRDEHQLLHQQLGVEDND